MKTFFRRLWTFVRPYRARLFLGLLCGVLYALANGLLILVLLLATGTLLGAWR